MSEISHIVKSYEEELQNLNDNLIKMGSLVETQLSDSIIFPKWKKPVR